MKSGIVKTFFACAVAAIAEFGVLADIPAECIADSNLKFGKVYCGGKESWNGWTEQAIWDGQYGFTLGEFEYALIPVTGSGTLKPVVFGDVPNGYIDTPQVWSDQKMLEFFTPKGVSPSKWEGYNGVWYYERSNAEWSWPQEIWPDNKTVEDRRWIVVRTKRADAWSGIWSLRVGIAGTSEISDPVVLIPGPEFDENGLLSKLTPADFIHGVAISGYDTFDAWDQVVNLGCWINDNWETFYAQTFELDNWKSVSAGKTMTFKVALPSAGTFVISGGNNDEESPAMKEAFSVKGTGVLSDTVKVKSNDWDSPDYQYNETNFFKAALASHIRRVKVSNATTLTFTSLKGADDCEFNRMYFFPENTKSVAIEAGFYSFEKTGDQYSYQGKEYVQGYVTGSGVYKSGETAMLKAVAGEGEEFDRWEVRFGNLTLTDEQKRNPVLSFTVTDAMCGDMEDEEQIFISAIWKPKYKVVVLPSIVGAGTVAGTGRYFEGEAVTLSATPADGCTFVKWSDGETSATRQIEVAAEEDERVIYACFEAPDGVPAGNGNNSYGPFVAGEKVEVDVGLLGYTAKGLPAGLKYDAKKGVVSGAAKTPGEYDVTFTKKGESDETVMITIRGEEVTVDCEGLSSRSFMVGIAGNPEGIPLEVDAETGVKSVVVAKLPAGMKYDTKTGSITGAPTKPGDYPVAVTVTTKSGAKRTETITVSVAALPDAAVGAFNGFVKASDGDENIGTVQVTTTDAGKITAKVTTAAGSYSFSGTCWDAVEDGVYSAALATKKGETLTLELDSNAGWNKNQLSGEFAAVAGRPPYPVVARRNAFGKTWYFNAAGNETDGWTLSYAPNAKVAALTVTLNADGSTKIAGKLGAISVNGSGYADVTGLADGVIHADFVPIVSMKAGKATVKRAISLRANLWFDRLNEHAEGAGTALVLNEIL